MKQNRLDCLIVPQHITQAMIRDRQDGDEDVQYLVGIPTGWVIVPADGKATAISSRIEPRPAQKRPIPCLVININYAYAWIDLGTNAPLIFFGVTEVGRAARILDQIAAAASGP